MRKSWRPGQKGGLSIGQLPRHVYAISVPCKLSSFVGFILNEPHVGGSWSRFRSDNKDLKAQLLYSEPRSTADDFMAGGGRRHHHPDSTVFMQFKHADNGYSRVVPIAHSHLSRVRGEKACSALRSLPKVLSTSARELLSFVFERSAYRERFQNHRHGVSWKKEGSMALGRSP